MRIGIVPSLNRFGGGIYQSILRTVYELRARGAKRGYEKEQSCDRLSMAKFGYSP